MTRTNASSSLRPPLATRLPVRLRPGSRSSIRPEKSRPGSYRTRSREYSSRAPASARQSNSACSRNRRHPRQQRLSNSLPSILVANVDVLQKESGTALEAGVVVEEKRIAGRLAVPFRHQHAKFGRLAKSIAQQAGLGHHHGKTFEFGEFMNERVQYAARRRQEQDELKASAEFLPARTTGRASMRFIIRTL